MANTPPPSTGRVKIGQNQVFLTYLQIFTMDLPDFVHVRSPKLYNMAILVYVRKYLNFFNPLKNGQKLTFV